MSSANRPLPADTRAYQNRLEALFTKVDKLPEDDFQLLAHWAAYLCVLTSGFLEIGLRSVLLEYASAAASPNVARYVDRQLGRVQNPNMEVVLQITRSFSEEWAKSLEVATTGEIAASVNSVIANRHRIAHGGNVDLTLARMKTYFRDTVRMLELLNAESNPAGR
jgi:hypothetical protein